MLTRNDSLNVFSLSEGDFSQEEILHLVACEIFGQTRPEMKCLDTLLSNYVLRDSW